MKGLIFLRKPGEKLVSLREQPYDSELILQRLLAEYPELLAGDQIDPMNPRRWLLVSQEMGVPETEDGGDRWSLDHLFLDQNAIPTLIETKRSSDTRIRREVVGQMLDYAANAVMYWPVERLINSFDRTCKAQNSDPSIALSELVGDSMSPAEFWKLVETNLKAGRIRLVFVADEIPPSLRRIVEFLNEQMDPAEVLAIEVKQFVGEGIQTLVPRVLGQTAESEAKKRPIPSTAIEWDENLYVQALNDSGQPEIVGVFASLLKWSTENRLQSYWGRGAVGSFAPYLRDGSRKYVMAHFYTDGKALVGFRYIRTTPGFQSEEARQEIVERLNRIPGIDLAPSQISGFGSFPMSALIDPNSLSQFITTLEWYFNSVRESITTAQSQSV